MHYFLGEIDKPSLITAFWICEFQDSYSINFHAYTANLTTMVQTSLAAKQVHIAAAASEVDCIKHENRNGTDHASTCKVSRNCLQDALS